MSIEALRLSGEISEQSTYGLNKPAIEVLFGRPLEAVKTQSRDGLINKSQVIGSNVSILTNPRVIEIKIPFKPETKGNPDGANSVVTASKARLELDNSQATKKGEDQLSACDVGFYVDHYIKVLHASGGSRESAITSTIEAVTNDGVALVQEHISAQKNSRGKYIVGDRLIQAAMQQTPTENIYLQTMGADGKEVIASPEHRILQKGIPDALTSWRRNNDRVAMALVQELALTLPANKPDGAVDYTLYWASPKAEEWEGSLINKYNGEYGYLYKGHLIIEGGIRKLIVHAYKADAITATFVQFMANSGGEIHQAPFENNSAQNGTDDVAKRPLLDSLMQSVNVVEGDVSDDGVIAGLYKAKKEIENSDRIFGILEGTMKFIQTPAIRGQIEREVAAPVAKWLVDQIAGGMKTDEIQSKVGDMYINAVRSMAVKMQKNQNHEYENYLDMPKHQVAENAVTNESQAHLEDLQRMEHLRGEFCGKLTTSSASGNNPVQDLLDNYVNISGTRSNVLRGAGGMSGEVSHCRLCGEHLCGQKKCNKCNIRY